MGFVKGLGNLLAGKPVFEDNGQPAGTQQPIEPAGQGGPKEIPRIVVERFEYNERGNDFGLNLHLKNYSSQEIFIDKVIILGNTKEIDWKLRPGEMREFHDFYRGKKLNHNNYKNCEIYYRTIPGDNFMSNHIIEYQSKGDGIYDIKGIKFIGPVKDLWGNN